MKKYIASAVLAFGVFISPALVQAQASDLTQSQINSIISLLQAFGAGQTTINNVEMVLNGTVTTGNSCYNFTTDLSIGMSGSAVTALQTALQNDGESLAVTGSFGDQTASAVTEFQQKYATDILTPEGLHYGTGYVGASTRAKLNTLCAGGQQSTTAPTLSSLSVTSGPVGTQVTLYGSNFTAAGNEIVANGMIWSTTATNNNSLTFNVPSAVGPYCTVGTACPTFALVITPGAYPLTVVNPNGTSNAVTFTVTSGGGIVPPVSPTTQPLIITTTSLQSGTAGAAYSTILNGTGGNGTYNWSISGIPAGLTVVVDNCQTNPSSCASAMQARIVGTLPSVAGIYPVMVQLQSGTQTVSQQFNLVISQ